MARLLIKHPQGYPAERAWILHVIIGEFLGIPFEAAAQDRDDVSITLSDAGSPELRIADVFFQTRQADWLTPASLPTCPLDTWAVPADVAGALSAAIDPVPVVFGEQVHDSGYYREDEVQASLGIDLFGSAFFMLSRYEEACLDDRDDHGRFPATASVATAGGFLDRPIVNEYLEILWACLDRLFPGLQRTERHYRVLLTHDVDRLFDTKGASWRQVARNSVGDLWRRRDPGLAARRLRARWHSGDGDYAYEPANTFEFIMDCAEAHGLRSAFYWICRRGDGHYGPDYGLDMPWVRSLMKGIIERGHELGLHPSYGSHDEPGRIRYEFEALMDTAESLGCRQASWGGRQHYLRWEAPATWRHWDDAALSYDSTLGYSATAGFRCGTCYEYPAFDLSGRVQLKLRERPLVAMDVALLSESCMALTPGQAYEQVTALAQACRRFGGDFTLLWHNDSLVHRWQKLLYKRIVRAIAI